MLAYPEDPLLELGTKEKSRFYLFIERVSNSYFREKRSRGFIFLSKGFGIPLFTRLPADSVTGETV